MRKVLITRVGTSTIVDIKEDGTNITETLVINKEADLYLGSTGVVRVGCEESTLFQFRFEELENKLSTANIRAYITAAATANLFS